MALKYLNQYISKTLSGAIDNSTTAITLSSSSGLETTKAGIALLSWSDPLDTSICEWVTYTSINGSNELQGVVRGTQGYSAKSHLNGAIVAFPLSESHINEINDKLTGVDTSVVVDTNGQVILKSGTNLIQKPTTLELPVTDWTVNTATGDGKYYLTIPEELNGMNLVGVHARVITAGTTNTTDIQIANVTDSVDMLSTKLTIDSGETGSDTAATPAVIDTTKDDVVTNDLLRIDIDQVSTTPAKGLVVRLRFALP